MIRVVAFLSVFLPISNSLKFFKFKRKPVNNRLYLLKLLFPHRKHLSLLIYEQIFQLRIKPFRLDSLLSTQLLWSEFRWPLTQLTRRLTGLWFKLILFESFTAVRIFWGELDAEVSICRLRLQVPLSKPPLAKQLSIRIITWILRIESLGGPKVWLVRILLLVARKLVNLVISWVIGCFVDWIAYVALILCILALGEIVEAVIQHKCLLVDNHRWWRSWKGLKCFL